VILFIKPKGMNIFSTNDPKEVEKELKSISLRYVSDDIPGLPDKKKEQGLFILRMMKYY